MEAGPQPARLSTRREPATGKARVSLVDRRNPAAAGRDADWRQALVGRSVRRGAGALQKQTIFWFQLARVWNQPVTLPRV